MTISQLNFLKLVLGLTGVLAVAAGCNGSSPSAPTPIAGQSSMHHIRGLVNPSVKVVIANDFAKSITPSGGTEDCWTVEPAFPSVSGNSTVGPVMITYDLTCELATQLQVTYAPTASVGISDCTFTTTYNDGFHFSVTNHGSADCKVVPADTVAADYAFVYNQTGASVRRSHTRL